MTQCQVSASGFFMGLHPIGSTFGRNVPVPLEPSAIGWAFCLVFFPCRWLIIAKVTLSGPYNNATNSSLFHQKFKI